MFGEDRELAGEGDSSGDFLGNQNGESCRRWRYTMDAVKISRQWNRFGCLCGFYFIFQVFQHLFIYFLYILEAYEYLSSICFDVCVCMYVFFFLLVIFFPLVFFSCHLFVSLFSPCLSVSPPRPFASLCYQLRPEGIPLAPPSPLNEDGDSSRPSSASSNSSLGSAGADIGNGMRGGGEEGGIAGGDGGLRLPETERLFMCTQVSSCARLIYWGGGGFM